ncbi:MULTISPECIES: DUF4911 domain-containing protein [unclassified Desulfurobacterium]|uniref:DUF4911 domain-containing protein n=1 Tax=unclassified Desulfurobacterium TaxID=2639089 RepID=UPI00041C8C88|nr:MULTISPECIES: DUF4911 domain-containing protein [unclassified Desulfurobacterium]
MLKKGVNLICKVSVKDIAFVNAIFEWYHEVGTVRTRDNKKGIIEIWLAPDFVDEGMKAIEYLKSGGFVEKLEVIGEAGDSWHRE